MDEKIKKAMESLEGKEPFKRLNDHAREALTNMLLPHQVNKLDERVYTSKEVEFMLNDVLNKSISNKHTDSNEIAEYVTNYLNKNAQP